MAISSILVQPAANFLSAAYRPILLRVQAVATNGSFIAPVVYCDIYFNDIYYKTISKTHHTKLNSTGSEWQFDIQDAAQEYLYKVVGNSGASTILTAAGAVAKVSCKFRSSGLDASGFIQYEDTKPIQGTGGTPPISGTGTSSNNFFVANASLQQEDIMNLESHLNFFKTGTWNASYFPLTHRPNPYIIGKNDSDFFGIADKNNGANISKIALNYKLPGQTSIRRIVVNAGGTGYGLYIPAGPKNLIPSFNVNLADVSEYFIELLDAANAVLATTVTYRVNQVNCGDDKARIHFQNYMGTVDALNFMINVKEHETKSEAYQSSLTNPLEKSAHGSNRFNIKSNDIFQATCTDYNEFQMDWIDELFDSLNVWMEKSGTQGQPDQLIPVVLLDKKIVKQKEEDRFINEITVDFKYSNAKILIRN